MANANSGSDDEIDRLVEIANMREVEKPPAPVPTSGFFWWIVSRIGPYAAYIALAITATIVLLAYIEGESWAWLGLAGLPISLFLILYVTYLVWHGQQQKAANYLIARQRQEEARQEIARQVLEQAERQSQPPVE